MKLAIFSFSVCFALLARAAGTGEREVAFLKETMVPLARQFVERNGLPRADFGTNNIKKWSVEFFVDGRPGCLASMKLKDGYYFGVWSDGTNSEIRVFHDGRTETYFSLADAPNAKRDAVKGLILGNKLNQKSALELAKKFFNLQGHEESNFHPPEIEQCYWVGDGEQRTGLLPCYKVHWYRKDVTEDDRKEGIVLNLHQVNVVVSGVTSRLISYDKTSLPIGRDF